MCAISPDGTFLATGSDDKSLCITNITTQAKVYTVECDHAVRAYFLLLFDLTITSRSLTCRGRPTGRVLSP